MVNGIAILICRTTRLGTSVMVLISLYQASDKIIPVKIRFPSNQVFLLDIINSVTCTLNIVCRYHFIMLETFISLSTCKT